MLNSIELYFYRRWGLFCLALPFNSFSCFFQLTPLQSSLAIMLSCHFPISLIARLLMSQHSVGRGHPVLLRLSVQKPLSAGLFCSLVRLVETSALPVSISLMSFKRLSFSMVSRPVSCSWVRLLSSQIRLRLTFTLCHHQISHSLLKLWACVAFFSDPPDWE